MSSVTISEVIILIASTILAGSFTAYAIYYGNLIQSNVASSIDAVRQQMNVRVKIIYATVNVSEGCFVVYVKNVGNLPISESSFLYIDLYIGPYGRAMLYRYSPDKTPSAGYFYIADADSDGLWEAGETAIFKAPCEEQLNKNELYEVKIYLRSGIGDSYLFLPP